VEGFLKVMTECDIEIVNLAVAGNVVLTGRVHRLIYNEEPVDAPGMGGFEGSGGKMFRLPRLHRGSPNVSSSAHRSRPHRRRYQLIGTSGAVGNDSRAGRSVGTVSSRSQKVGRGVCIVSPPHLVH